MTMDENTKKLIKSDGYSLATIDFLEAIHDLPGEQKLQVMNYFNAKRKQREQDNEIE